MRSAGNRGFLQGSLQVLHIHVLFVAPLGTGHMTQPSTDQHKGGVSETDGRYHSETFGTVAKETPAQSGTLTIWHQSQNTTQKFGGNAYGNQENYVHHHYPAGL